MCLERSSPLDRPRELLSCVPGDGTPGPFYEKMGFTYTGTEEGGELVMRRPL